MKVNKNKVIQDDGMAITIVDEGTAMVEPVALQSDLFRALENIRVLTNEITDLGKSINNHSVNLKEINEQVDTLSLNDRSLRDDLAALKKDADDYFEQIDDLAQMVNGIDSDFKCFSHEFSELSNEMSTMYIRVDSIEETLIHQGKVLKDVQHILLGVGIALFLTASSLFAHIVSQTNDPNKVIQVELIDNAGGDR